MNNYNDDIKIPKEYLNISNLAVYDTINKLHGIIIGIKVRFSFISGFYLEIEGYFDKFNSEVAIYKDDFAKGRIKFVIVTGYQSLMLTPEEQKDLENQQINAIKAFLGDKYTDDCILRIAEDKRNAELKEQEYRAKEKIGKEIKWAESATQGFIFESYSAMEVLELYKNKAITENQFLVELINILAAEKRAKRDTRLKEDYLTFEKNTKEFIKNNKEILRKMMKNATDKKETDGD